MIALQSHVRFTGAAMLFRPRALLIPSWSHLQQADRRTRYNCRYTADVKTAVSLPDDLFLRAEATAYRVRVSRSEFYARAIAQYLKFEQSESVTERLNDLYSRRPAKLTSALHKAQIRSLKKEKW